MDLNELLEIACRYDTAPSDAMIKAVINKAIEDHVTLVNLRRLRQRPCRPEPRERAIPFSVWKRYVERNSDTRWNHC